MAAVKGLLDVNKVYLEWALPYITLFSAVLPFLCAAYLSLSVGLLSAPDVMVKWSCRVYGLVQDS